VTYITNSDACHQSSQKGSLIGNDHRVYLYVAGMLQQYRLAAIWAFEKVTG
jgi:hypothetical protein